MGAYFCSVFWVLIHLHCKRTHTHTHQPVVILHGFISASLAAGTGRTALRYWTNMADTADEGSKLKHTLFYSVSPTQTHTLLDSSQQAALLPSQGFHTLICCSHNTSEPRKTIYPTIGKTKLVHSCEETCIQDLNWNLKCILNSILNGPQPLCIQWSHKL